MHKAAVEQLPELIDRRTATSRHYERPDGLMQAIVGLAPINYRSGGKWKRREDYALAIADGEIRNDSDELPVRVKGGRVHVRGEWWEPIGLYLDGELLEQPADVTPIVDGDRVLFPDLFAGIDLEYLITPHRVKESIHVRRNPLVGRFVNGDELVVRYRTSARQDFRQVWARDRRRELEVVERWSGKTYELGVPTRELRAALYPIEIDPTVTPIPTSDVYLDGPDARQDSAILWVGHYHYDDGKGTVTQFDRRAYLRYDFSSITGAVSAATKYLYRASEAAPGNDSLRQSGLEVDPETGDVATVWSSAAGTAIGLLTSGVGWASRDITAYAEAHRGGFCDFGMLGVEGDVGYDAGSSFYSSEEPTNVTLRPYASVTYAAGGGGSVAGVVATATGDALTATINEKVTGPATPAATGDAPASAAPRGFVNGVAAASTGDAPASVQVNAKPTAAAADASADAPAGAINAAVLGASSSSTGDALPASGVTVSQSVAGVVADSTADSPSGAAVAAQVLGAASAATGDALAPQIVAGVTAAPAAATADAAAGTISAAIAGLVADATADAGPATIAATVPGAAAEATAAAESATITATVNAGAAEATADAGSATVSAVVDAAASDAIGDAGSAAIVASVDSTVAAATADALPGVAYAHPDGPTSAEGVVADASADALPAAGVTAWTQAAVASSTADARPAKIRATVDGVSSSSSSADALPASGIRAGVAAAVAAAIADALAAEVTAWILVPAADAIGDAPAGRIRRDWRGDFTARVSSSDPPRARGVVEAGDLTAVAGTSGGDSTAKMGQGTDPLRVVVEANE